MAALLPPTAVISEAQRIGSKVGIAPEFIASFGQKNDLASPFIEIDWAYHYVVRERGAELNRKTTLDIDELLYWMFEGITFGISVQYELGHRDDRQDFRRILFNHQLELLGDLNPVWRSRCALKLNEVLKDHPFLDNLPLRNI